MTRTIQKPHHSTSLHAIERRSSSGFTIVELIIVIVVIAILATIGVIGYGAYLDRAGEVAIKSDLQSGASTLESSRLHDNDYPDTAEGADSGRGLPASKGTTLNYFKTSSSYCLEAWSDRKSVTSSHIAGKDPNRILDGPCVLRVTVLAGSSVAGYVNGPGAVARFNRPHGVAVDKRGNVYVADWGNGTIRKISPDGATSTLAGNGTQGFADGPGTSARLFGPHDLTVSDDGTVFVADRENNRIRKISANGYVTTLAGSGTGALTDGVGAAASFDHPSAITVAADGTVYVADTSNHAIRKITPDGMVTTIAGNGTAGFAEGNGSEARFRNPWGIAVDSAGTVYVADADNHRIRKITTDGAVTTLAGDGGWGFADGQGTAARFTNMHGITIDPQGNLYAADVNNNRIRRITPDGTVTTPAGTGEAGNEIGDPSEAQFYNPHGIAVTATGTIYVADTEGNRICRLEISDEL